MENAAGRAARWARENPGKAGILAAAGVVLAAPVAVTSPVLAIFGFGANGIIGGTVASAAQAGIGNVAAGSLFATLQSAAMGGYGAATVNGVVQAGAVAVALATASGGTASQLAAQNPFENLWNTFDDDGDNNPGSGAVSVVDTVIRVAKYWNDIQNDRATELANLMPRAIETIRESGGYEMGY